jgi:hypothetical protein
MVLYLTSELLREKEITLVKFILVKMGWYGLTLDNNLIEFLSAILKIPSGMISTLPL